MKAVSGGEIGALLVTQKSGDCLASVSIWHARPPQSRWLWAPGSAHGWRRQLQPSCLGAARFTTPEEYLP